MQNNQTFAATLTGGCHYPKKMRRGWCVAHTVIAAGITIERYGARYQTYGEAFEAAERMNRQEAEAQAQPTAAAADAALRGTKACKPQHPEESTQRKEGGAAL